MGLRKFAAALAAAVLAVGMSGCGGETKVRETAGGPTAPDPIQSTVPGPGPSPETPDPGPVTPDPGPVTPDPGGGTGATPPQGEDYGLPAAEVEYLDALWEDCAGGDMAACDLLYWESPINSHWEEFGDTCGGTAPGERWCEPGRTAPPDSQAGGSAGG
ncbi:MAG: hypothetical protein Q4G64_07625 [bacterium]|nr:hypothetical protein [bacterium]